MAAVGTALGATGKSSLFAWPPSEEAVQKHGPLALVGALATCAATLAYTYKLKEESHTPSVLKVRSRSDILKTKSATTLSKARVQGDNPAGKGTVDGEVDQDKEWRETELTKRKPKLLHLMSLASNALDSGEKCPVRFKDMFEACVDVRHLDFSDPDLGRAFHLAASILVAELVEHTKLTLEGKSVLHKTGEDLADLVSRYSMLHAMCKGLSMSKQESARLWGQVRTLWWQSLRSQLVLWRMRIPDVAKACRVVLLAKRYLPLLVFSSACRVASNSVRAIEILHAAEGMETLRKKGFRRAEVLRKVRAYILLGGVRTLLDILGDRLNLSAMLRMSHKLRTEVYSAILRQDMEWYRLGQQDQRDVHGLFGQIFDLPRLAGTFVNAIIRTLETVVAGMTLGSLIRQRSTGFVWIIILVEFAVNVGKTGMAMSNTWLKSVLTRTMTKVEQNWIEPMIPENITTIRACAAEGKVLQNWNMFFRTEHEMLYHMDMVDQVNKLSDCVIRKSSWCSEMFLSARLVQEGKIPHVADVESLHQLGMSLVQNVWEASWAVMAIKDAVAPLARTYEVIFTHPRIGLEGGIVPSYPRAKGGFEFRAVSFSYPGTGEVLSNVSFTVPPRHTCGVTGSSGAGKSTLLLLMQRLYDPQEGEILIDGMDIRTLNPMWVRRQMAVVSQRPRIFAASLLSNLTYGCEIEPSEEEVQAACRGACFEDVVFKNPVRFPLGLHTRVSNETLSGGELQRVAIARALLKDSPILLLDEATSALDSESQSQVKEGLKNLMKGRTVIVVAHRLETIKDADSILCIEGGRVREQGRHQELVQRGGLYSRLYRAQIESTISGHETTVAAADAVKALQATAVNNSTTGSQALLSVCADM